MAVIQNKWVEKEKKKKAHETAPAYEINSADTWSPKTEKSPERHTNAARATYKQTLRGIRK